MDDVHATDGKGPLAGLKVIELAGLGPAPFAGMTLADLGAEVVCVDRPGGNGVSPMRGRTDILNRGKKSVLLDLKQPEAVEAVLTMAAQADVVLEGFRPGVAERLGVGPLECRRRNPRLVYGRMTGWGENGPWANTAGHDIDYIAVTGALHAIGEYDGPPQIPLNLVGDFGGGGAYLVIGVLAALREAALTGQGRTVDAAIVDGTAHLLAGTFGFLAAEAWTDARGANLLDGGTPFYAVYETSDRRHMAVGAIEGKFYAQLLTLLGIDEDPADQHVRATWPRLRRRIADAFASRTQTQWAKTFDGTDACVAPVLSLRESADHPHLAARGTLVEVDGVLQPRPAPRFDGHEAPLPQAASLPGGDTVETLRAWSVPGVEDLVARGIAAQA
ncbi:acyl-CoA transferase/carnitine dehydratase [Streptomyces albus]|nr:acyl-CoA transferase/carnitine dehydratase [Streptomyces albus]